MSGADAVHDNVMGAHVTRSKLPVDCYDTSAECRALDVAKNCLIVPQSD